MRCDICQEEIYIGDDGREHCACYEECPCGCGDKDELCVYSAQHMHAVDGGEVLPLHNHIYVDGYCACGHAVERHRH